MRIYISGPVTGMPDLNREAFAKAEVKWTDRLMEVCNPHKIVPPGSDLSTAMDICIDEIARCDLIYMLDGWQSSIGARIEKKIAEILNLGVIYEAEEPGGELY